MSLEEFVSRGHARRGGRVENYFCLLKRRDIYKNFSIVARFNKPVNDRALLFTCLRQLILQYPILAASVVTTDRSDLSKPVPDNDYIKVMNTLRLDDVLMDLPASVQKTETMEGKLAELNKIDWKYGNETPLWKISFIDPQTLVYISNHVCSDGMTGKNFIKELSNLFNTVSLPSDLDTNGYLLHYVSDYTKLPQLPPPIEKVVNYSPPLSFFPSYFWNLITIKFMCTLGIVSKREDTHSYRIVNIPSKTLTALLANLKPKGITLSPYINSAWVQAFQEVLLKDSYLGLTDVSIPCDSRQFIEPGVDTDIYKFGSNTGGNHFYHRFQKEHNWSSVQYFNGFFQWCKRQQNFLYGLGMITSEVIMKNANFDKIIDEAVIGVDRTGTVISNIGVIRTREDKYEVEDLLFSKNSGGTQFSFSLGIVSTKHSGMNCVITMCDGAATPDQFDQIVKRFKENIIKLA